MDGTVKIEATCPTCGTIECTPSDFELRVANHAPASYYAFTCPKCLERVRKHADQRALEILIAEGIVPLPLLVPAEALEPREGPPLTADDLLDFHQLLEKEDWFDAVVTR